MNFYVEVSVLRWVESTKTKKKTFWRRSPRDIVYWCSVCTAINSAYQSPPSCSVLWGNIGLLYLAVTVLESRDDRHEGVRFSRFASVWRSSTVLLRCDSEESSSEYEQLRFGAFLWSLAVSWLVLIVTENYFIDTLILSRLSGPHDALDSFTLTWVVIFWICCMKSARCLRYNITI